MNAGHKFLVLAVLLVSAVIAWRVSVQAAVILVMIAVTIVWAAGRRNGHW